LPGRRKVVLMQAVFALILAEEVETLQPCSFLLAPHDVTQPPSYFNTTVIIFTLPTFGNVSLLRLTGRGWLVSLWKRWGRGL
jgi:hypothetical protein